MRVDPGVPGTAGHGPAVGPADRGSRRRGDAARNVWTLAPGGWSWGRHAHREQEELYLVLDGRLRVEAGGETFVLGPRDALVVPSGVGHQLWNTGEEDVTYLAAAAPPAAADSAPA